MVIIWDIIAGYLMGILTGMGIGGGGLLVLYLTAARGIDQLTAQGCNLLFFVFSSVSSMFVHKNKRELDFRMIGLLAALAIVGSQIGVRMAGVLPEETVRHLYGWMLVIAGTLTGIKIIRKK